MTHDATILIVDDDPTNLKVLQDTLKETGYKLLMAKSGQRALYQVEHQPPDLILLDVLMPDIDGFETCRRLKRNPKTEQIPVIFLTALNDVEHKIQGFAAGGIDYVTKPFQQPEVLARVNTHLQLRQMRQQLENSNQQLARRVEERTAQLSRALRAKDDFMATMTHELRTPLNGILGMVEILRQEVYGPLNEDQRQPVEIILQSGQRLLTLINEILDLAEIDKLELDLQPVLVADVCQTSLWQVEDVAAQKKLQLLLQLDDYDLWLQADPRRLQQILVNLLDNAIKFTPAGGEVTLFASADPDQSTIRLSVQDTGIGIAADDISRLFKPFTQLDAGLSRQYEGAGMGLAMVQQLVRLHGGSIEVTSAGVPGQGSYFTVSLPWQAEDN